MTILAYLPQKAKPVLEPCQKEIEQLGHTWMDCGRAFKEHTSWTLILTIEIQPSTITTATFQKLLSLYLYIHLGYFNGLMTGKPTWYWAKNNWDFFQHILGKFIEWLKEATLSTTKKLRC